MPNRPRLSKAELEVARTVWRLGQATMGEVYEAFPAERVLDYTTVQTYVRRLESKGYLKSKRVGRNKIYSPKVRPGTVIGEAIDEFMHQLFDGDLVPLVKHLVEDRGISNQELDQLAPFWIRRIIAMNYQIDQLFELAWTQLWQVTLLAAVVALITARIGKRSPHLAHVLWAVVIVKCLTPPVWTSSMSAFSWIPPDSIPAVFGPADARFERETDAPSAVTGVGTPLSMAMLSESVTPIPQPLARDEEEAKQKLSVAPLPREQMALKQTELATPGVAFPWVRFLILLTWFVMSVVIAIFAIFRWRYCQRIIRSTLGPVPDELTDIVNNLRRRLGIARPVELLITRSGFGPLVFGYRRATLVIPDSLIDRNNLATITPILAHELIHFRRGDTFFGIVQFICQSIWWFHPLVWMANRHLNRYQEYCCDEETVASINCGPSRYARSLLHVLEMRQSLRPVLAAPGVRAVQVTSKRLEMIVNHKHAFTKRTPWWCCVLAIAAALVVLPAAGTISGQEDNSGPEIEGRQQAVRVALGGNDWKKAARICRELIDENDDDGWGWFHLGYSLHMGGKLDEAIKAHIKATDFPSLKPIATYNWACALALKGKPDEAMDKLEESLDLGFRPQRPIMNDPDFKILMNDKRFRKLVVRSSRGSGGTPIEDSHDDEEVEGLAKASKEIGFLLGKWNIVSAEGDQRGSTTYTATANGYAITENYVATDGLSGQGMMFFDPGSKKWRYTWVDSRGRVGNSECEIGKRVVTMKGTAALADGRVGKSHAIYKRVGDDKIKHEFQLSRDGGENWETIFDGYYVRRNDKDGSSSESAAGTESADSGDADSGERQ